VHLDAVEQRHLAQDRQSDGHRKRNGVRRRSANGGGNRSGIITNDGGGSFPIPQLGFVAVQTTVNFGTPTAIPDNGTVNIALPYRD
jgi:hypothetical protein